MKKAYHPYYDKSIDLPAYIIEFGNNPVRDTERARCPTCNQRLSVIAKSTTGSHGHFAHSPGSGFCPTKKYAEAPYIELSPRNPNSETAKVIKSSFLQNWGKHYSKLNWIVKCLHINEFKAVVEMANRARIWEYASLEEFQIPYILATLTDFPQRNSYRINGKPQRKYWFRCWFDSSVQRYDDLWIQRNNQLMFWRGWYDLPGRKRKPGVEDLIDSYPSELSGDFLNEDRPVPEWVEKEINKWLPNIIRVD